MSVMGEKNVTVQKKMKAQAKKLWEKKEAINHVDICLHTHATYRQGMVGKEYRKPNHHSLVLVPQVLWLVIGLTLVSRLCFCMELYLRSTSKSDW